MSYEDLEHDSIQDEPQIVGKPEPPPREQSDGSLARQDAREALRERLAAKAIDLPTNREAMLRQRYSVIEYAPIPHGDGWLTMDNDELWRPVRGAG